MGLGGPFMAVGEVFTALREATGDDSGAVASAG
jgi:hypothetical protein